MDLWSHRFSKYVYPWKIVRIPAMCSEGRNLDNLLFVFWEKRWLHKFIIKLTDLHACSFFPQSFPIIESRKEPIAMQNYWNVSDNGLSSICGLKDLACLKNASSTLKSLYYASLADVEVMQILQKKGIDCNCPAGDIQSSIIHSISKSEKKSTLAKNIFSFCFIQKNQLGFHVLIFLAEERSRLQLSYDLTFFDTS